MSRIPEFIEHFKASAKYHRTEAKKAEAEVERLKALLPYPRVGKVVSDECGWSVNVEVSEKDTITMTGYATEAEAERAGNEEVRKWQRTAELRAKANG